MKKHSRINEDCVPRIGSFYNTVNTLLLLLLLKEIQFPNVKISLLTLGNCQLSAYNMWTRFFLV